MFELPFIAVVTPFQRCRPHPDAVTEAEERSITVKVSRHPTSGQNVTILQQWSLLVKVSRAKPGLLLGFEFPLF